MRFIEDLREKRLEGGESEDVRLVHWFEDERKIFDVSVINCSWDETESQIILIKEISDLM
jgi:hypothetical protein